jgi:hypothetical protein
MHSKPSLLDTELELHLNNSDKTGFKPWIWLLIEALPVIGFSKGLSELIF